MLNDENNMSKRITIMVDDDLDKKVRRKQSDRIKTENRSISYSSVINDVLRNDYKL